MKKKGMIPEHHRKASEEKWAKIIKAIDDGWRGGDGAPYIVDCCGYCRDVRERGVGCSGCYISKKVCNGDMTGYYKIVEDNIASNPQRARKYAVKIHDYIKNDKPGD